MARSKSSKRWLQEHFSDPHVQQAQLEGYRSRAVYKLLEIQKKDRLIKPGQRILDLGAAPGGWSQYASQLLQGRGTIIAVDILPMDALADVQILQGDFTEQVVYDQILDLLQGQPVDLVLSDMAPNMSGMDAVDQPRSMYLAELALDMAQQTLARDGCMLIKLFQGAGFDEYLQQLRASFKKVVFRKPEASRSRSREVYALACGVK